MARARCETRNPQRATRQTGNPTQKSVACQRCHARKIRCSGNQPCNNCRSEADCIYPQRDRQVKVQQSYIDKLLHEIEELRGQNGAVASNTPSVQLEPSTPDDTGISEVPLNPLLDDKPWFTQLKTSKTPILIGEASDAAFATRFRQTIAPASSIASHIPRTHYVTDEVLSGLMSTTSPWPSSSRARFLVEAALRSLCRCYHLVRRTEVLAILKERDLNGKWPDDPITTCKMWALFAIGELYTTKSKNLEQSFPGLAYFAHGSGMLRVLSERPQLDSIETLLLLSLYSLELNRRHSAYTLVGTCIRLAAVMGLHLNVDQAHIADPELREHRNRLWWTAYIFDRMWSSKTGLPTSISDDEISVDHPSRSTGPNQHDFVDHEYLVASVELARLAGRINTRIYSRPAQKGRFLQGVQDLLKSLQDWAQGLPAHLQVDTTEPDTTVGQPVSLHLSFNQCLILATRPILLHVLRIHLQHVKAKALAPKIPESIEAVAMTCVRCARHSCSLLTACWINGTFHVFDYFYTQYLFSAATILAISSLIGGKDSQSDADNFEMATGFLLQLEENGNCAAMEFSSHVRGMKAAIQELKSSTDITNSIANNSNELEPHHATSTFEIVTPMTAETALAEPSLQQFLSEDGMGMEFFDQFLVEDTQGIFSLLSDPAS